MLKHVFNGTGFGRRFGGESKQSGTEVAHRRTAKVSKNFKTGAAVVSRWHDVIHISVPQLTQGIGSWVESAATCEDHQRWLCGGHSNQEEAAAAAAAEVPRWSISKSKGLKPFRFLYRCKPNTL